MTLHELLLALRAMDRRDEALRAFERLHRDKIVRMVDRHQDLDAASREAIYDHVYECIVANERRGYRGERGDDSAWAWVGKIVSCKANDARRRVARTKKYCERHKALERDRDLRETLAREDEHLVREAYEAIRKLLAEASSRDDVASEWNELVELAFTARWNPMEGRRELVERGMLGRDERDPEVIQRARDRLYQYRRRGRLRLAELLEQLVARGRFDADAAERVARLHRAPWPPVPRRGRG